MWVCLLSWGNASQCSYSSTGDINLTVSKPPIYYCKLQKSVACIRLWHVSLLATCECSLILLFFSLGAYGWLDCVGPCQGPSITPWCPAELEIHSAALSPQNEKTRARGNKVRLREREGKGDGRNEKLNNSNRLMEKKRRGGKKSKERTKYKDE